MRERYPPYSHPGHGSSWQPAPDRTLPAVRGLDGSFDLVPTFDHIKEYKYFLLMFHISVPVIDL